MVNRWFISKDARIALIGAGATVVAALVVGGFGLVNKGLGKTSISSPKATVTVTESASSLPSSIGQDSETPNPQNSSGNSQYLSDMQPAKADPDDRIQNEPATVKQITYENSLVATTSVCGYDIEQIEQDYAIPSHYRRFQTGVGITDGSRETNPLTFYVLADNKRVKTIYSVEVSKPQKIDISVTGVSRIGLVVKEQDACDADTSGAWMDPRLIP